MTSTDLNVNHLQSTEPVAALLDRAKHQVGDYAQQGIEAVRTSSRQLRAGAQQATDGTLDYIRREPVKATLLAAAAGAALMALAGLISRAKRRD
jgi:ElaB/YqjD/DUF883 family membrane-anchored ribosome-binding protein